MKTSLQKSAPPRVVLVCGTLALGLAVLCLLGWVSRNWILASFGADKIQMAPSTGLGVLVLGAALVAAGRQTLATAVSRAGLGVALFAGLNLALWLAGRDSPVDAYLSDTNQTLNGVLVGRMSPVTAVLFLSTGLGLFFRSRPGVAAPGALVGLGAAVVLTLGYWGGIPDLFYDHGVVPPALPTSLCLSALNAGLLFLVGPGFAPLRAILGDSGPARVFRKALLALVIVGLATILRELLVSGLGRNIPFLTYFPAVMVVAILGGPLAGAVATVVSFPLAVLWIQKGALSPVEWVAAGIFLLSSGLIVGVARALLRANRRTSEALALADQQGALLQHEVEALRSVTRRLELSLAAAQAGTWEWVLATNVNYWSDEIWALYGLSFRQVEPSYQAWLDSIHPSDRDRVAQTLAATVEVSGELRLEWQVNGLGPGRWLMSRGSPEFDQDGRTVRYLGVVIDISDRKRAEQEAGALQAQLLHAQTLENLGGLAGGIAHDMNNVLAAILTQATAKLMTLPAGDGNHATFERIARAAERGGKMVKSLLSFARKDRVETKVVDLNALVHEEMDLLERTTESRLTLKTDLDPSLGAIEGDPSALSQVLMNLCVNAIDAMEAGGVLTLTTRNQGACLVQLLVGDTGTGMAPEVLARCSEPFFTTKPVGKGTGLGLSLAETVVRAHHGTLKVESVVGQGTLVTLSFPVATGQECADVVGAIVAPGPPLTILLVDDDDLVRDAMAETLGLLGHVVTSVSRGEAALEQLAQGLCPDLVVLDMNMPGIGGAATLGHLRRSHPVLPVLLATGRTDQSALDLVAAWPHVTLLPKPYGIDELVLKLHPRP